MTRLDRLTNLDKIRLEFRDHDNISATGQTRLSRNPPRILAHDLNDHDAVMTFGRGVQPVNELGRHLDSRVKTTRVLRA